MWVKDAGLPYLQLTLGPNVYYLQRGDVRNERGEPYRPIPAEVQAEIKKIDKAQLTALGF